MSVSEWKEVKLGEVCNIRRGSSPRPIIDYLSNSGMPWVKIADATESNTRFIEKTNEFIKLSGIGKSVVVNPGSLILSNSGTAGLPKFMGIKACIHDGWQVFDNLQGININYLYYELLFIRNQLLHGAYDSTMKNLTLDMVRDASIDLPPINEQITIAHSLSCLDDKIELNNHINKTLEEMAQAIFKSWFVDFEPFQDGGFEESELGMIPKGWRVVSIQEYVSEIKNGGTPSRKKEEYWCSQDIPWIKTGEICNGSIISCEEFISQEGLKNSSAKLLPKNTVLLAMYGATAGKVGLLRFEATTNQACCAMICENVNKSIYLYLYLLQNQTYIESLAVGAAQQNLSKDTISKLQILLPNIDVFDTLPFEEIFNVIEDNLRQNQTLTAIRDSLLPKLMSGEIRVPIEEVQSNV